MDYKRSKKSFMSKKAIDLLFQLVSIPSPSKREVEASLALADWMSGNGAEAFVDEAGNAVGYFGQGPKEILLLGHIDTFPGLIPVKREGDWLYGRGSVDAKGPLCAFAAASSEIIVPRDFRLTVVGAVEEEIATSKGARHIISQRKTSGITPVCCVIGEPSHWDRITLGYKGRLLLDLRLKIALSHSSGPAKPPPEVACEIWNTIGRNCKLFNEDQLAKSNFEMISPSLRKICSEDVNCHGVVSLSIGFRLPLWISPDRLKTHLLEWLIPWNPVENPSAIPDPQEEKPGKDFPNNQDAVLGFSFTGEEVCWKGTKSNFLVKNFLFTLRENQIQPRFVVKTGTSDLNVLGPAFPEMPILAYGPGDSTLDHTPEERINLNEYLSSIKILKETLYKMFLSID